MRLFAHQQEQLTFFRSRPRALSLLPYGAGKTLPTIWRLADLVVPLRALIVTTTSLLGKWELDLYRFGGPGWITRRLHGTARQRLQALRQPHHVGVVNYEGIAVLEKHLGGFYDVVVFDEIHRLRNAASRLSRAWARFALTCDYAYGLTGSPVLESPMDLFGIVRALDPNTFGTSFRAFLDAFFDPVEEGTRSLPGRGRRVRLKPGALIELCGALHAMSIHRSRDQLDASFPRVTHAQPLQVELAPAVRRIYDRIERRVHEVVRLRGIGPQRAGVQLEKLAQASRAWLYGEGGSLRRLGANRARTVLQEYLEAIRGTGPVVIWAARGPDLQDVSAALGSMELSHRVVRGSTPLRRRDLAVKAFNAGDLDALVAHPRCLGEGVDLQAPYSLRYSYRWSAQEHQQALGRLMRPTNAYPHVTHSVLVAERTIDEGMLRALKRKQSLLAVVLAAREFDWNPLLEQP